MPVFRYEVTDARGKVLNGAMDAPTPAAVEERLRARGYRSIHLFPGAAGQPAPTVPSPPASVSPSPGSGGWVFGSPRPQELASFFRQMASLLHSGFTISSALTDLGGRMEQRQLRQAARDMGVATGNGESVAGQALHYPAVFPPHVVALLAAGEQGGFLEAAFEEAALWAEQEAALRQGMWVARFLIWQSVWSVLLFAPLFPSLEIEKVGESAVRYAMALLLISLPIGLALHGLALFSVWLRRQPSARPFFDGLSLRLPVAARYARMQTLAAFTRVLRRLLMAGISPETAYTGAAHASPNLVLRDQLLRGVPALRSGQGIDAAVQATGLMASDPLNLLITGQKTGRWQEMLEQVTVHYQEEAARAMEAVKSAQRRFGGILTLITSGYIMIVATHGLMTLGFKFTETFEQQ